MGAEELIRIVTTSFEAEKTGDIKAGKSLIRGDFKKISMVVSGDKIFPALSGETIDAELEHAYKVKGRQFYIWNIAVNVRTQTVFVELAEIEPRENNVVWPYVLVCQIKDGKIWRSRHYGDPEILKKNISIDQVRKVIVN